MGNPRYVVDPRAGELIGDALEKMLSEKLGPQIVEKAKQIVPVRTGALRRSITFEVYRAEHEQSILFVGVDEGIEGVNYGAFVEDGTSRMKAQPYLRPAIYQVRAGIK